MTEAVLVLGVERSDMAAASRTAPTTVLLVRHGQTPTTGKVLPGRAPGLHLSDEGSAQAEARGRSASPSSSASPPSTPRRSSAPARRRAPIAAARGLRCAVDRGLLECDFGEWTGAELKELMQAARVAHRAALPERRSASRAARVHRDAGPHLRRARPAACARHPGGTIVAVSHADPIKAAVAHALGTHLDLFQRIVVVAVLDHRRRSTARDGPGRARRELDRRLLAELAPVMSAPSTSFDSTRRRVHRRHGRPARASACSTSRPATARAGRHAEVREAAGGALGRVPAPGCSPTSPARRRTAAGRRSTLLEPVDAVWTVGPIGVGYDEADDRIVVVARGARPSRRRGGRRRRASAGRRARLRAHPARRRRAFVRRTPASCVAAGRPPARSAASPMDPDGHTSARACN